MSPDPIPDQDLSPKYPDEVTIMYLKLIEALQKINDQEAKINSIKESL